MPSLQAAIGQALEDAGLGVVATDGTGTIHLGQERPEPDQALTVLEEAAGPPTRKLTQEHGITVRTRAATAAGARSLANLVDKALNEYEGCPLGVPIARIFANFQPVPLGRDPDEAGGRPTFTQTFTVRTKRFTV